MHVLYIVTGPCRGWRGGGGGRFGSRILGLTPDPNDIRDQGKRELEP
jgi:hypothetical protein